MEAKRMDFKDFITYLHDAGNPQYAKIHTDNIIEYCTYTNLMHIGVLPNIRDEQEQRNIALGFASAISPLCPEEAVIKVGQMILPLREKEGELEAKVRSSELTHNNSVDMPGVAGVRIFYQTKTPEEFKDIREFFESIPEDTGMPKKGQTFFGYD